MANKPPDLMRLRRTRAQKAALRRKTLLPVVAAFGLAAGTSVAPFVIPSSAGASPTGKSRHPGSASYIPAECRTKVPSIIDHNIQGQAGGHKGTTTVARDVIKQFDDFFCGSDGPPGQEYDNYRTPNLVAIQEVCNNMNANGNSPPTQYSMLYNFMVNDLGMDGSFVPTKNNTVNGNESNGDLCPHYGLAVFTKRDLTGTMNYKVFNQQVGNTYANGGEVRKMLWNDVKAGSTFKYRGMSAHLVPRGPQKQFLAQHQAQVSQLDTYTANLDGKVHLGVDMNMEEVEVRANYDFYSNMKEGSNSNPGSTTTTGPQPVKIDYAFVDKPAALVQNMAVVPPQHGSDHKLLRAYLTAQ